MGEESLGKQIERLRKKLGFSQESLAEEAGLNLRTIQRIENGETIPRADSLKRITQALKVTPDEIMDYSLVEDKVFLNILNLSALGFMFFPLLGILLPLIFWIMKRDKIKCVDYLGKRILNFQITLVILFFSYYAILILTFILEPRLPSRGFEILFRSVITPIFPFIFFNLVNILYIVINEVLLYFDKTIWYKPAIRFLK